MEQFLDVPVTQRKAVIEPDGVLDDDHGETVAVWLDVSHGHSAYPDPIKATQPSSITGSLKTLSNRGLLKRHHGQKDGNLQQYTLTPQGEAVLDALHR